MKSSVKQGLILLLISMLTRGSLGSPSAYNSDNGIDSCSVAHTEECFDAFNRKWNKQDGTSLVTGLILSEEQMHELCSDFDEVKQCMFKFQRDCDTTMKKLLQGVYAMFDYICHKGLQVYLRNRQCLATPALTSEIHSCNTTSQKSYEQIAAQLSYAKMTGYVSQDEVDKQKKKFCSTTDDLMHCLKVATSKHCSLETKDFVANVFNALLKPMLKEVDCGGSLNRMVWYAIALAAGLLCTALISWCVRILKSRRQHHGPKTGQVLNYSDRSMLTTNEVYYDDPPLYRSQVQMQRQTLPPQPMQPNTGPVVAAVTAGKESHDAVHV